MSSSPRARLALMVLLLGGLSSRVEAQARWDPSWREVGPADVAFTTLAIAGGTFQLAAPQVVRWEGAGPVDVLVRDALISEHAARARRLSDVLALSLGASTLGLLAGATLSHEDPSLRRNLPLVVARSFAFTHLLTSLVKRVAGRRRPFCEGGDCHDSARSFFSGHASYSFTAASMTCTMLRQTEYGPRALRASACGLSVATAFVVGFLRLRGGRHHFSDVVIGALVGVLSGFVLPRLLTFNESST